MRKIFKTKQLLLNLGPLDHALLTYLTRLTNKKAAVLFREGLRHLAHTSPTFNVAVFHVGDRPDRYLFRTVHPPNWSVDIPGLEQADLRPVKWQLYLSLVALALGALMGLLQAMERLDI